MTKKTGIASALCLLVLGAGTITLFQNCSSGSVPSDVSSTSNQAAATMTTTLLMYPAATSVTAGGTVILTVTGGTSPYSFAATGGTVTNDPLAGYIYTAPATPGSYVITVTDANRQTYPATLSVIAATTTPTPVVSASVPIYRFFNTTTLMHSFSNNQSFGGGTPEGQPYYLASTSASGAVPFYQCAYTWPTSRTQFYFDTTQSNCENVQAVPTQIGFIYPAPGVANTQPLYRFHLNFQSQYGTTDGQAVDHLDSTNPQPEGSGWVRESVLGYVPLN